MSRVGEGIGSNGLDSATNTGDDQPRTQPSVARPALPVRVHANADDVAPPKRRRTLRVVLLGSATTLLAASVLALVASSEPDGFDVTALAAMELGRDDVELVAGAHTTAALIGVSHTLLSKSGGYLRNDVLPPWSLLDNMPSWERGVVIELRDSVRALRNDFSREQTQSAEDRDLAQADAQFHFDDSHWMLPATEEEFAAGTEALRRYLHRLHTSGSEQARFFVRADNLNFYLATVGKRLGAYAQQLSGNVLGPSAGTRGAEQGAGAEFTRTPWKDVDNVFYEARGYAWALLHTLRGIERDFGNVIEAKAADGALEQIIRKLEETQATVRSPLILNTSGFGLLTNHSLVMASYMSRANAALIELRQLIAEG